MGRAAAVTTRNQGRPPARRARGRRATLVPAQRPDTVAGVRNVRIIPCLDVDAGRVVKGVRFNELTDAGDPVELARRYDEEGADELVFLDITASAEARDTIVD